METLKRIVSGGQTGADRAALDAALEAGFPCGGWCPADRRAEDGTIADEYPLQPMAVGGYIERTWQNVIDSDGTVIISHGSPTGGSAETLRAAEATHKPCLLVDAGIRTIGHAVTQLRSFIDRHRIAVLNVAGPRASNDAAIYSYVKAVVTALLDHD